MSLPETMLAWPLYGAGMDALGKDDKPCEVAVPEISDDELLVKIDAIGLCFSDIKLIRAGVEHPRVISEDLTTDPVIPGHEAVMTVVKVGDKLAGKFGIGQRFIIQADIYVNGEGFAYGYAIDGGMSLYSRIDQRVLDGDEGCYLLPLADHIPAGIAALIEPWTCVIASYRIEHRDAPKAGGTMLIAASKDDDTAYELGDLIVKATPASITLLNGPASLKAEIADKLPGTEVTEIDTLPADQQFDDIFICNLPQECAEKVGKLASRDGLISFIGEYPDEAWAFDVGNIHYDGWFYQGTATANLSAAYGRNLRSEVKKGGTCWLLGGAGAMGQMHTQLAIESEDGPSRILVTDMDDVRIENVKSLLGDKVKERGIDFQTLNPGHFDSVDAFNEAVAEFAPEGFDDVVMLVPVVPVLNGAVNFLKEDGLMNIFAGIPAGKEGSLNVKAIAEKGVRYIGSSGSKTADLRYTLSLVEEGKLNPATALAAIGGMQDLKKGLNAVADATFPGKTVIFPHCDDMPLTTIENIGSLIDGIEATFNKEGFYSTDTEKALMDKFSS